MTNTILIRDLLKYRVPQPCRGIKRNRPGAVTSSLPRPTVTLLSVMITFGWGRNQPGFHTVTNITQTTPLDKICGCCIMVCSRTNRTMGQSKRLKRFNWAFGLWLSVFSLSLPTTVDCPYPATEAGGRHHVKADREAVWLMWGRPGSNP